MNIEKIPSRNKKFFLGITVAFIALGWGLVFLGTGSESQTLLSQFSGTNVTPGTASERWKSTPENPHRSKVWNYNERIDGLVVHILARGWDLQPTQYKTYLDTIVTRFTALSNEPDYAKNQEIQDIIAYMNYELVESSKVFATDTRGFDRMMEIVNTTATEIGSSWTWTSQSANENTTDTGSTDSTLGTYRLYLSGSQIPEITKEYVTESGGLTSCMESHNSDPKFTNVSIKCTWEAPCGSYENGGLGCTPPSARTKEIYNFAAVATFSVKGSFTGAYDSYSKQMTANFFGTWTTIHSGATVSGCGKTAFIGADGKFSLDDVEAGSDCRNITATKTGIVCAVTTDGPEKLEKEVTDVAGACTLKRLTVKYDTNGAWIYLSDGTFKETQNIGGGSVLYHSRRGISPWERWQRFPFVKPRHTFDGWSTEKTGGKKFTDDTLVTEDLNLYASWIPYADDVFTMTFDQNGGTDPVPKIQFKPKNAKVGVIVMPTPWDSSNPDPFRSGFKFDGWWTAPTGGVKITPDFVITADMKAYAHWREFAFSMQGDTPGCTDLAGNPQNCPTNYTTTPPGCTDSATPTCEWTTDTVTKSWAKAKDYCENMTFNGHSDWFLPNKDELNALYAKRLDVRGFNENTPGMNWTQGSLGYWSSTESEAATAFNHSFRWSETMTTADKNLTTVFVRCVRKVPR